MDKKIVCIDPGHGGRDPGACGYVIEKHITLEISMYLQQNLVKYSEIDVIMTRTSDVYVSLAERCRIANDAKANIFVSIHCNAGGGEGFESYVLPGAQEAAELQKSIHEALAPMMLKTYGIYPVACVAEEVVLPYSVPDEELEKIFRDRGRKYARFYVLKHTEMPAVLLECLFVDNKRDTMLLKYGKFKENLAEKIAEGIANYFGLRKGWDPQAEIDLLLEDKIINTRRTPDMPVNWGEFATVINRLRGKEVSS